MKGNQVKFLASVADLARLDFEAASITLVNQEGRLVSRYQGAYSSGQRWLDLPDAPNIATAVSAKQFKDLAGLFSDDEDIEVTVNNSQLNLKSRYMNIDLNMKGEPEGIDPYEPADMDYLEAPVSSVLREMEIASEFSARSMARPILTGLRIEGRPGQMTVQSSDGVSTLFETKFAVNGDYSFNMIAPAYDLVLGLRLLDSGSVKLLQDKQNHVVVFGDNARFQSSVLRGEWPNTDPVKAERERQPVNIPTGLIRSLVQSVRILGSSNDLRLRGDGENLYLETIEAEAGHFEAHVESNVSGTYTFDVGSFLLAQNLGSELMIHLPTDGDAPTLVTSGERQFWIAQKKM